MSKELKHMPAPWHWGRDMQGLYSEDYEVLHYESYEGMNMPYSAYREGNAALIAAAPDLLAALKSMVKLIDDNGLCVDECEDYDNALAAIAKATGSAA